MRSRRRNAWWITAIGTAALTTLAGVTAQAASAAAGPARVEVEGVLVRMAEGHGADGQVAVDVPGGVLVPVTATAVSAVPAGAKVRAVVEVPAGVVEAARAGAALPGLDGRPVALDRAQLAAASDGTALDADAPLAEATAARAAGTGTALTAGSVQATPAKPATYRPGPHTVTVAIVTPRGVRGTPATSAQVRAQIAAASAYWSAQSRGGVTFAPGVVSAPYASAYACTENSSPFKMWDEARRRTGFLEGPNRHLVLVFPTSATSGGCSYGLASIGDGVNAGGVALVSDTAWPVLAHEIGHNLGLGHAKALRCTRSDADFARLPAGCSVTEYGYPWSVMAASAQDRAGALSTVQAARVGLLTAPDIVDVTAGSRTVALRPVSSGAGLRAVTVTDPRSRQRYFVEYRTQTGTDRAPLYMQTLPAGVRILRPDTTDPHQRGAIALDMTPTGSVDDHVRHLASGRTFTSHGGGATVRVNAVGATASVTVTSRAQAPVSATAPVPPRAKVSAPKVNALASTTATARLSWSGTPAGGRYDVRFRPVTLAGGAPAYGPARTWFAGTKATSGVLRGSYGGGYQVSARARTATGTVGAWSPWAAVTMAVDAGGRGATLTKKWSTARGSAYYAGTALTTSVHGASLRRGPVYARTVQVVGTTHPRGSVARVYVDGRLRTTVSTYAPRTRQRQLLANIAVPWGAHTVQVVNVATKARPTLVLDAVGYVR